MKLNEIADNPGAKHTKKRVGRGIGSGLGKTCGRGHKGQKARAGGFHKVGFEGGQMPLQRRLPKRGFRSLTRKDSAEVRLAQLNKIDAAVIDLEVLKQHGFVPQAAKRAKVINTGKLERAVNLRGVAVTQGAAAAITQAGGKVEP